MKTKQSKKMQEFSKSFFTTKKLFDTLINASLTLINKEHTILYYHEV